MGSGAKPRPPADLVHFGGLKIVLIAHFYYTRHIKKLLPVLDEKTRKKINLAIYHDGLAITTIYVNNVLDKFRKYFNNIFLVGNG